MWWWCWAVLLGSGVGEVPWLAPSNDTAASGVLFLMMQLTLVTMC